MNALDVVSLGLGLILCAMAAVPETPVGLRVAAVVFGIVNLVFGLAPLVSP